MMQLAKEQEILMNVADMAMAVYGAESVLLRTQKLLQKHSEEEMKERIAMTKLYIYEAAETIRKNGNDAVMSFAEGDEMRMMLLGVKRFSKVQPFNVKEQLQMVAQKLIEKDSYCF